MRTKLQKYELYNLLEKYLIDVPLNANEMKIG